jgi:hypothetical protein
MIYHVFGIISSSLLSELQGMILIEGQSALGQVSMLLHHYAGRAADHKKLLVPVGEGGKMHLPPRTSLTTSLRGAPPGPGAADFVTL